MQEGKTKGRSWLLMANTKLDAEGVPPGGRGKISLPVRSGVPGPVAQEVKLSGIPRKETGDYVIVSSAYPDTLRKQVNDKILEGYEPLGNVTIDGRDGQFHQAMLKRA